MSLWYNLTPLKKEKRKEWQSLIALLLSFINTVRKSQERAYNLQFSIFISGFRLSFCLSSCCLWRESIICLQYQNDCQKKKRTVRRPGSLYRYTMLTASGVLLNPLTPPPHTLNVSLKQRCHLRREVSKPDYNPWARTLIIWAFIAASSVPWLLISILLITGCHLCSERTLFPISQCLFIIRTTL